MKTYKLGGLNLIMNQRCTGYSCYFGNLESLEFVFTETYFKFLYWLNVNSFFRLEIFTEENDVNDEVNYEFLFRRILPFKFCKTFSIGKFYVTFLNE